MDHIGKAGSLTRADRGSELPARDVVVALTVVGKALVPETYLGLVPGQLSEAHVNSSLPVGVVVPSEGVGEMLRPVYLQEFAGKIKDAHVGDVGGLESVGAAGPGVDDIRGLEPGGPPP